MISRVHSSILQGPRLRSESFRLRQSYAGQVGGQVDAVGCEVEADVVTSGTKADIKLVGLADKAVQVGAQRRSPVAEERLTLPGGPVQRRVPVVGLRRAQSSRAEG